MQQMADGEIQVLVCTTIIETGIDIPNVNTLIIEDADRLGLSQLHQIRGRIGRSARRAYAYLTYRRGKVLTEVAEQAPVAPSGSTWPSAPASSIAMRDLEIRGAGNLLGPEQSGYLMSVGYDMYLRAAGRRGAGGAGRGARTSGPRLLAPTWPSPPTFPSGMCPPPRAAHGPVPPHGGHPHHGGRRRTWWTS